MSGSKSTVPFGFRDVEPEEKPALVRGIFSSVASRYDLMNDLMSFAVHRLWKDEFVAWLDPRPGWAVLDVAGGTGDIAMRIDERIRLRQDFGGPGVPHPAPRSLQRRGVRRRGAPTGAAQPHRRNQTESREARSAITVCDVSFAMLTQGMARPGAEKLDWLCGDAEQLPIADASQDAYTIAFGIRNCTHLDRVLKEAHRVLKPGGRFLCLEFSKLTVPGLDAIYDVYSFSVLPRLGEVVAGDGAAYRYLAESIRRFPSQKAFAAAIAEAGFGQVKFRNLSGGIAAMHSGWKL
ncbi:MAG: class I SAM-dependent methyltransferase [Alphaproteobacteria bacterium]|nr:class I SAM-dependent methyltransferase [Alphaproteobacteria bacterium]